LENAGRDSGVKSKHLTLGKASDFSQAWVVTGPRLGEVREQRRKGRGREIGTKKRLACPAMAAKYKRKGA